MMTSAVSTVLREQNFSWSDAAGAEQCGYGTRDLHSKRDKGHEHNVCDPRKRAILEGDLLCNETFLLEAALKSSRDRKHNHD
jgi:hypothetical protein